MVILLRANLPHNDPATPNTLKHGNISDAGMGSFPLTARVKISATVYPSRQPTYAPEGMDPDMARDFEEALRAREAGLLFSSALVARRVLQVAGLNRR